MLGHEFMRLALLAGTPIALACGVAGYFAALRAEVFAGDLLGHVAFTGALGAGVVAIDLRLGLFGATLAVALALGVLSGRGRSGDVMTGSLFAWVLGIGALLLTAYDNRHSAANGASGVRVLFGSIFGLSPSGAWIAAGVGMAALVLLLAIARPLLFATLDREVAAARGVRVRPLGVAFLVALALVVAEATQAIGALLVLGLLAAPAGAARLLSVRPYRALALSAGLALLAVWLGLAVSYLAPSLPPSFAIVALATAGYVGAGVLVRHRAGAV
jgi:zinc/manganese transport system permease protein